MAGSLTDAMEVEVLKLLTGQATTIYVTTPIVPYIGLFSVTPSDSAGGTECVIGTNGYQRIITTGKWLTPPAGGSVNNNATIQFATASGAWAGGAALVAFGIFTSLNSTTLVAWGSLTDTTKTVNNGDTVSFASGSLVITCD
jgi:hypothetical protein